MPLKGIMLPSKDSSLVSQFGIISDLYFPFQEFSVEFTAVIDGSPYKIVGAQYTVKSMVNLEKLDTKHFTYNQGSVNITLAENKRVKYKMIQSSNKNDQL